MKKAKYINEKLENSDKFEIILSSGDQSCGDNIILKNSLKELKIGCEKTPQIDALLRFMGEFISPKYVIMV